MDDLGDPNQPVVASAAIFPDPPPFWRDFTRGRLALYDRLCEEHLRRDSGDPLAVQVPDLPHNLMNMRPPTPPSDGRWRVFGDQYTLDDKLPSLEEQSIERLAPVGGDGELDGDGKHFDRAFELKRLAKSLLLNFLELVAILSIDSEQAEAKIGDIRTLLINFHHILNEYRPHQARESAIALLQDRLDRTRTETANVRALVDRANRVLEGLASLDVPGLPPCMVEIGACPDIAESREGEVWAFAEALAA